jgi:hypothetical protein
LTFIFIVSFTANAQTIITQGFDGPGPYPAYNLPFGWNQATVGISNDPDNYFFRTDAGNNPAVQPFSPPAMLCYNSNMTDSGGVAYISSNPINIINMPITGAAFSFYMYRDSTFSNSDRIEVYVNSSPSISGATLLPENVTSDIALYRNCNLPPINGICNGWNQYFYTIPSFINYQAYVIFKAYSSHGGNIYIDNFSIDSYSPQQTYVANSAMTVFQNTLPTFPGAVNQQIIGCKITMNGAAPPLPVLDSLLFNTNGSTSPATDIVNAKLWFTGGTDTLDPNYGLLIGTYTSPYATNFLMVAYGSSYSGSTTFTGLQNGDNYFWLTYNINPNATLCNYVDADWLSFTLDGITYSPNPFSLPGNRQIGICTGNEEINNEPFSITASSIAGNELTVTFENAIPGKVNVKIIDVLGKTIIQRNCIATSGTNRLSIPVDFRKGVYHLLLQNNSNIRMRKFIN